jgi:acetate kinase
VAVFLHRLRREIGAMAASLGGVDQIALSGGIGSHDDQLVEELSASMRWLGPVGWHRVAADEEGMVARLISRADPVSDAGGDSAAADRH